MCQLYSANFRWRIVLAFDVLTEPGENYRPNDDLLPVIYHNEQYPPHFYTFPLSGVTNEINDDFIKEVGEIIKPGGSALLLLIAKWTEDKALERLNKFNATIIRTSLSKEEDEKLKAAFDAGE